VWTFLLQLQHFVERVCNLESHHLWGMNFFVHGPTWSEWHQVNSFLGLHWGCCSSFITKTWNGMLLRVFACKAVKFSCIFIKNKLLLRGSCSVDSSSHVSHLIMRFNTNTDYTCTELMQMHSSWREDAIRYFNLRFLCVSSKSCVLTVFPLLLLTVCSALLLSTVWHCLARWIKRIY
jgi:hypothetical protein